MKRPRTTVVLPDVHVPWHHEGLTTKIAKLIRDIKPHELVFTGDFLDLYTLSRHNEGSLKLIGDLTLEAEYREGRRILNKLESGLPKGADKVYIYGNHEDRFNRFLASGDAAKIQGALTSPEAGLGLHRRGYRVLTNWQDDSHVIGSHLEAVHGTYLVDHAAKKHLDGFENSVIFGHTHRFQIYLSGKHGAYNVGFLGDASSQGFAYAPRVTRNKWVNGFAIVYTMDDGTFLVNPIQCWNGRFVVDGRIY